MRLPTGSRQRIWAAVLAGFFACGIRADANPALNRELEFASALVEMGFPDFAERLLDRMKSQFPDMGDRGITVQVEILISRRRFDQAEKISAELDSAKPASSAIRLAIANGYFRAGELERARNLYQAFFDQFKDDIPRDPDVRRFYLDAAYRFGQMLVQAGDLTGAAKAYENVLKAEPPETIQRFMQYELASL
ncbi:MAG: tetratricopeptide repeat protein, partial [Kiritimatiellia bacterium]|nr:tetratricopeptide repeat protein [Kiritimatiellia bacterium]